MLTMKKINSPTRHFLMRDGFVALITDVSELKRDKGTGGSGEQCDEAGDDGIAWNPDGVWTAFSCETAVGGEINTEKNDDSNEI